jgi:hypothetical protein
VSYPQCDFCGNKFRYEPFNVECHIDPNIGTTTIGKERTVATCKESLPTSCGPHRNRFLEVRAEIRAYGQRQKKISCRSECIGKTQPDFGWRLCSWMYSIILMTRSRTTVVILSPPQWFTYKVSGVMCSVSVCEHCWSIEGWIHCQRRNRLDQKLVEKLVRTHTNLVLRESLDNTLRHLLPWDIELVIDEPVNE